MTTEITKTCDVCGTSETVQVRDADDLEKVDRQFKNWGRAQLQQDAGVYPWTLCPDCATDVHVMLREMREEARDE